jgi:ribosomal subunit interface protein
MQIKITGKHLDIGTALRTHIDERLQSFKLKYFEGTVHAAVILEKQHGKFHTDCTLHLATGLVLQAQGNGAEAFACFDAAAHHLEKQLKRYKNRLKDHHKQRREPVSFMDAQSFVIQAESHDEDDEPAGLNPVVIAESVASVPELSVGEAVMQLDLSTIPFVLFRNSRGGQVSVVYRRVDGNIGWVDPRPTSA